jgi:23S rRNA (uridine2552-2'-O)-methyltransferase
MVSSKSSKKWLEERARDQYVKKSKQAGFRSRASFKLLEIQEKDRFIQPGMIVVDLGSAPGGWSQAAKILVGDKGSVLATDILPMAPISGVKFIQGDFTEDAVFEDLIERVGGESVDLVISDMAPNITGIRAIDQPGSMHLAELALDFARSILREGAYFLVKVFEGEGIGEFKQVLASEFEKVKVRKPKASRSRSREFYLLAEKYRNL